MQRVLPTLAQCCVLGAALVIGAAYHALGFLNHDTSYLLVATERWLEGATLYGDIMEINPPLIFYLTAPAVVLATQLGISSTAGFIAWIGAGSAIALAWCWSLLSRVPELRSWQRFSILGACLAVLIFTPSVSFGQREHVFIVLALPYLMQQVFSPSLPRISQLESAALGAVAVLGIALKPFFLLPVLILAYVRSRRTGSLRPALEPANICIVLGCLLYVLGVAVLHPEYFTTVLPMGASIYGSIGYADTDVVPDTLVPLLMVVAIATVERTPAVLRERFFLLAAMLAGMLGIYVIQFKGWPYQMLPFECMAIVAGVVALVTSSQDFKKMPLHFVLFAIVPALLVARATYFGRYDNGYVDVFERRLEELSADWKGRSVLLLSTDDYAAFPLINKLGTEWAGRYAYQWVIAGAVSRQVKAGCTIAPDSCPGLTSILDYGRRTNVDDIVGQSPDVVIVDVRPIKSYVPVLNFDYIEFLKKDPRFDAKWREYRKIATELNYDIWVREPANSAS